MSAHVGDSLRNRCAHHLSLLSGDRSGRRRRRKKEEEKKNDQEEDFPATPKQMSDGRPEGSVSTAPGVNGGDF